VIAPGVMGSGTEEADGAGTAGTAATNSTSA
jgi:hypothetical protein